MCIFLASGYRGNGWQLHIASGGSPRHQRHQLWHRVVAAAALRRLKLIIIMLRSISSVACARRGVSKQTV